MRIVIETLPERERNCLVRFFDSDGDCIAEDFCGSPLVMIGLRDGVSKKVKKGFYEIVMTPHKQGKFVLEPYRHDKQYFGDLAYTAFAKQITYFGRSHSLCWDIKPFLPDFNTPFNVEWKYLGTEYDFKKGVENGKTD